MQQLSEADSSRRSALAAALLAAIFTAERLVQLAEISREASASEALVRQQNSCK